MAFQFTPSDGYRNTVSFPTKPANETAFRDSMQDLLDQVATELNAGTNSASGIASMSRQAMINGNFEIAQRGTSFTSPLSGAYTLDRYQALANADGGTLPTLTHSQQPLTPGDIPNSYYFYRLNTNGPGTGYGVNPFASLNQLIENGVRNLCGAGKKMTISFYARSSITNKRISVTMFQAYGTGGSPTATEVIPPTSPITLTSTWTKYTVTFNTNTLVGKTFGTNNNDYLRFGFQVVWGTGNAANVGASTAETFVGAGNIDIAQVQVNAGDTALPFQPRSFAQELQECMRYYFKTFPQNVTPAQGVGSYQGSVTVEMPNVGTSNFGFKLRFPVVMRSTPTVTTYNPSAANANWRDGSNSVDRVVAVQDASDNSVMLLHTAGAGAANSFNAIHVTADAEL